MNQATLEFVAVPDENEADASLVKDTRSTWLRFVFTDAAPNANNQGVKEEEFDNLITTGVHKPVKKTPEDIGDHTGAIPIGSIASLKKVDDKIVGLANIWDTEYPEEVKSIKEAFSAKQPIGTSWEILYSDSEVDENGVEWLKGCITKAVALVKYPAYENRTPILAIASKWSPSYIKQLPDEAFLYVDESGRHFPFKDLEGNIDTIRLEAALKEAPQSGLPKEAVAHIVQKIETILHQGEKMDEIQKQLDEALAQKTELEAKLASAMSSLEELVALKTEVEELRAFKAKVEADMALEAVKQARSVKLAEAGIDVSSTDFDWNKWVSLDDEHFDFVVEILKAQNKDIPEKVSTSAKVPHLASDGKDTKDAKEILRKLLEERKQGK